MMPFDLDWRHAAVAAPALGALAQRFLRDPGARWRLAAASAAAGFAAACLAAPRLDPLAATLMPLVGGLHLLTLLATTRAAFARTWISGHLAGMALRLAATIAADPLWFAAALAAEALVPLAELRLRGKPWRLFVGHAALAAGLMALGAWSRSPGLLVVGAAVRCGLPPGHLWVADLFRSATFGTALLHAAPMLGLVAVLRWGEATAQGGAWAAWAAVAALYFAGLAVVQRTARGFFARLFASVLASVWCGLASGSAIGGIGACGVWFAGALALTALGLTLRALEHRHGPLPLVRGLGLHRTAPQLAAPYLIASLCVIGFPGTLGFVFSEALVDGVLAISPGSGVALAVAAALQGIAALRAYWLLFSAGDRFQALLPESPRERYATLTLSLALLLGGAFAPWAIHLARHAFPPWR